MELGDNTTYSIQGVGSTYFQLNLGYVLHVDDIMYVIGLKKNLMSISVIEDKGFKVIFMDNKALLWPKNSDLNSPAMIGVREGGLYKDP